MSTGNGHQNPPKKSPLIVHTDCWKGGCGASICEKASRVVHVRGQMPCDIAFVGEAPGESEDTLGIPFIGIAGKLLDRIVEDSGAALYRCAFMNLVGCIPRGEDGNKVGEPSKADIESCMPRLRELLGLAKPKRIVAIGALSAKWVPKLLATAPDLPQDMVSIVHPAAILRANVASQGLMVQRCIVTLENAILNLGGSRGR